MGFMKIRRGNLTSRIGRKVAFGAPRDVRQKGGPGGAGEIVDEVWFDGGKVNSRRAHKHQSDCWGDYAFCGQLIKWKDEERYSIRLAYYRRRCGENHWEFASQTTVTSKPEDIKKLLEATLAKKEWFRRPG
jgi:hypothetical protein